MSCWRSRVGTWKSDERQGVGLRGHRTVGCHRRCRTPSTLERTSGARDGAGAVSVPTHYEMLGLNPDATGPEIKAAYRAKVRSVHPDLGGDAAAFVQVQAAYETLGDEQSRAAYDDALHAPTFDEYLDVDDDWGTTSPLEDAPAMPDTPGSRPTWWQRRTSAFRAWLRPAHVTIAISAGVSVAGCVASNLVWNHLWFLLVPALLWFPAYRRVTAALPGKWIAILSIWALIAVQQIFANYSSPWSTLAFVSAVAGTIVAAETARRHARADRRAAG